MAITEDSTAKKLKTVTAETAPEQKPDEEQVKAGRAKAKKALKAIPPPSSQTAKALPPPIPKGARKLRAVPTPPPAPEPSEADEALAGVYEIEKERVAAEETDILDGVGQTSLYNARHAYEFKDEANNTFADAVASTYEGFEYKKGRNEDRIVINPQQGLVTVIDGMGGGEHGDRAAQVLAEEIKELPNNIAKAVSNAEKRMGEENMTPDVDGACFLTAELKIGKPIKVAEAGDVDLFHFNSEGGFKFKPEDRLKMKNTSGEFLEPQSIAEFFISDKFNSYDANIKKTMITNALRSASNISDEIIAQIHQRIDRGEPVYRPNDPVYYLIRNLVGNAVTPGTCNPLEFETSSVVESKDIVIIMSDGTSDNFTNKELQNFVKNVIAKGMTAEEATKALSDELDKRMRQADKVTRFKKDNASVVVMFIR